MAPIPVVPAPAPVAPAPAPITPAQGGQSTKVEAGNSATSGSKAIPLETAPAANSQNIPNITGGMRNFAGGE